MGEFMFTVKQVADRLNISEHTLRYYDRQGLMPFLKKDSKGRRTFTEEDISLIELIICLKKSHMSLEKIREYIEYQISEGDTSQLRKRILENHKQVVMHQIEELNSSLCVLDYKLKHCICCNDK